MRELSLIEAPALRALAALCLSDPSNPINPGYGVTAEDVAKFWLNDLYEGRIATETVLRRLGDAGYVRRVERAPAHRATTWTPTARGWQAALWPELPRSF